MYRASYRAHWLAALFLPLVQLISALALSLIVLRGGQLALEGSLTIGSIQAFISYLIIMLWPIQDLARVFASLQQAVASAERTFSLIDTQPELEDRPGAYDPGSLRGDIEFQEVDFQYEADKPVLQGFSLTVRQGETIAIVGPTGAGKTSIANLIARFYDVSEGELRIDGIDIRDVRQRSVRRQMGLVSQDPFIFAGAIADNIRFGKPEASLEEVVAAGELANVGEFARDLPRGYETEIYEDGANLSVGQRQLISIARAILADPRILIMDEATSSVDMVTEALIQDALKKLLSERSAIVIAHRLSTIVNADMICVVDDGRIHEQGTHTELLRQRGLYFELYERQFVEMTR
jgi:ABC-type multidrug transport system fused ATPase/permease subunit